MNLRRLIALSTCTLAVAAAGCEEFEQGRPFQVVAAQRQTLAISAEAAGILEPVIMVEIKSKASGEILSIQGDTGDLVDSGTTLVRIDKRSPRNQLNQAQAELEFANAEVERLLAAYEPPELVLTNQREESIDPTLEK